MNNNQKDTIIELLQQVINSRIDLITFIEKMMFEYINMDDCELKQNLSTLCDSLNSYFIKFGDNENVSSESLASTIDIFNKIENTLTIFKCS